jgi:hypothetical protein
MARWNQVKMLSKQIHLCLVVFPLCRRVGSGVESWFSRFCHDLRSDRPASRDNLISHRRCSVGNIFIVEMSSHLDRNSLLDFIFHDLQSF